MPTRMRRVLGFLGLVLLACQGMLVSGAHSETAETLAWVGVVKAAEHEPRSEETLRRIQRFLRQYPRSPFHSVAEYLLSETYFQRGEYASALAGYLPLALDLTGNQTFRESLLFRQGESYLNLGNVSKAESAWRELARQYPETYLRSELALGGACLAFKTNRMDRAREELQGLLSEHPEEGDRDDVKLALAQTEGEQNHWETALENIEMLNSPAAKYWQGRCQLALEHPEKAAEAFAQSLAAEIPDAWRRCARFLRAEALLRGGLPEAERALRDGLVKEPRGELAFYSRLKRIALLTRDRKYPDAFSEVVALQANEIKGPNAWMLPAAAAEAYAGMNGFAESSGWFQKSLVAGAPETVVFEINQQFLMALVLAKQWNAAQVAALSLEARLGHGPGAAGAKFVRAVCAAEQNRPEEAIRLDREILEQFGDSLYWDSALVHLQMQLIRLGKPDWLAAQTGSYLKKFGEDTWRDRPLRAYAAYLLSNAGMLLKQGGEARRLREILLRQGEGTEMAGWVQLGLAWEAFKRGDCTTALGIIQQGMKGGKPESAWSRELLLLQGHCHLALRQFPAAVLAYTAWMEGAASSGERGTGHFLLGVTYDLRGNAPAASQAWDQCVSELSEDAFSRRLALKIPDWLFNRREYEQARKEYQQFLEKHPKDPESPTIYLRLAQTYYQSGQDQEAMLAYREFLRTAPEAQRVKPGGLPEIPEESQYIRDTLVDLFQGDPERVCLPPSLQARLQTMIFEIPMGKNAEHIRGVLLATWPEAEIRRLEREGTESRSRRTAVPWLNMISTPPLVSFSLPDRKLGVKPWKFTVAGADGKVLSLQSGQSSLPKKIIWDGRKLDGQMVAVGEVYSYSMVLGNPGESPLQSVSAPMRLNALAYQEDNRVNLSLLLSTLLEGSPPVRLSAPGISMLREAADWLFRSQTRRIELRLNVADPELGKKQAEAVEAYWVNVLGIPRKWISLEVSPEAGGGEALHILGRKERRPS